MLPLQKQSLSFISNSCSIVHRNFYSFLHEPKYQMHTHCYDKDFNNLKKDIFVAKIQSFNKKTGCCIVQKIDGQTLSEKYGSNIKKVPIIIQNKIENIKMLGLNCSLDMSKITLDDITEDKNGRLWITCFQNVSFFNYN